MPKEVKQRKGLITARKKRGLTQQKVASNIGISRPFYSQIENGERSCSLEVTKKLSIFLGVDVRDW